MVELSYYVVIYINIQRLGFKAHPLAMDVDCDNNNAINPALLVLANHTSLKTLPYKTHLAEEKVLPAHSTPKVQLAFTPHISDFYKALMVQAQRLHLKHEDFDVMENTILDSHLFPEHFKVHADEVDVIGHWEGNTHCKRYAAKIPKSAVCALAGFYAKLQMQIFPFVEDTLANLRQAHDINYSTINFLELLQLLYGYFWQMRALKLLKVSLSLIQHPALLKWLQVSSEAKTFLQQWPRAREAVKATAQSNLAISS
ncbi:hypothetical protein BDR05DRAFT_945662 [Suillus weaverae]|nr:hypothetical protein BDR05DRAFT_945662 [Suillus weaverae]